MKTCPRCARSYPDSESFCETDGTALVAGSAPRTSAMPEPPGATTPIECPVCGGKAEPGEIVCNFCGAKLVQDEPPAAATPAGAARRSRPETFVPAQERVTAKEFRPSASSADADADDERRRPLISIIGYTAAAIIALAAGAWLAIHLSSGTSTPPKMAAASPVATPAPAAPLAPSVELAKTVPLQTIGVSAAAPERSQDAARKMFEANKNDLLEDYHRALGGGPGFDDAMMVRLTIAPSGAVTDAAVRTSTAPNPALDAAVVGSMMGWRFAPFNGSEVKADYPVIFSRGPAQAAAADSALATKVAALGPAETPEYASAPPVAPAAPAATSSPAMEAEAPPPPSITAPEAKPRPKRHPRELASLAPRRPPLLERVQSALRADRRLNRVKAYTSGGVVTLYGRVYDDSGKRLAERTVRGVSGVTDVIDQITTDQAQWASEELRISQGLASAGLTGVTVKVIGRDAYLDGQVNDDLDRERAVTIAEGAAPVKVRTNLIRVAPGRVFGF
jgi:TonB family protein